MRNKMIRHLSMVLVLMLFVGVLAACNGGGSGGNTQGNAQGGSTDNKGEKVTLQFYMLEMLRKTCLRLSRKLTSLLEADLNVNVKFNFTSWTDWDQNTNCCCLPDSQLT